jgi:sigma-B regulation protein RsbU (phosphoserine phosphatase)
MKAILFALLSLPLPLSSATTVPVGPGKTTPAPGTAPWHTFDNQIRRGDPLDVLYAELNAALHRVLARRTFICLAAGTLDPEPSVFRLANAGCPYPYHYRAATGEIAELQVDGYPLGVRANASYELIEAQLAPGDRIVFCSDGIVEADDPTGAQFGFDATAETARAACAENLPSASVIDHILEAVATFKTGAPQSDDMTCIVLHYQG